jgi:ribonucleotide reductase alpha subunit
MPIGKGDTYCLTEPGDNQVVIEGYQVGQCLEQSLESYELCNLVETFPANHEDADDYMRTLKFAYLYAKTVTLLPTHNPRTNQVTLRNRRIGLSQSGIVQAFAQFGLRFLRCRFQRDSSLG